MISTTDLVFIDTNVLIYARDDRNATKRERARSWLGTVGASGRARTNLQVLNELTRWLLKKESHRSADDIRSDIAALRSWGDRPISEEDVELAWSVRNRLGYQWFDCLLVAGASLAGCRFFLTEDMGHGTVFEGLALIDPFQASPNDVFQRN
ncbi:hypothetical protein ASG60_04955 [Methylobacterium sp. Leaf469]|uniref:PIN domain-containing protein n=1 Tax=Methylobacterium sp. Leaf469 TaxID=1736387 RepID=UPI0006F7CC0B|nr:PIN domain-containing protein [Methylobacterium sp. Leaf469]KQT99054.1 hypothetical protein ASG60_04955 [Methylobacterium sp. Leaf469]